MQYSGFTQWLLGAQTPSIRYLTLNKLLNKPEWDFEVRTAQREMNAGGAIPTILAGQTRIGSWSGERSYYTPKYTSTHWSMLLLAELATSGKDSRMRRGAIFMLGETWDELQERIRKGIFGFTCFWGNLLRYSLHCDLHDDPRLRVLLEALVYDALQGKWRCQYNDEQSCAWGAARALWGMALLPEHLRAHSEVESAIQSGLTFLLEEHHLEKANYPTPKGGRVHPLWFRLNFPLFYQADILFVLRTLAELDALEHPGARQALAWLVERRAKNGHWRGANPYRQRTWQVLGDRTETDRWVSLHSALVLNGTQKEG